jgi:uncharacterized protein YjbI with pentapeptide repeats
MGDDRKEFIAVTKASKGKIPKGTPINQQSRAQLFLGNADNRWWTKHVASFLAPNPEEINALVEKIRNNSREIPRTVYGFLDLQGVDLRGANLQGTHLFRADLQGANLQGVNLQGVDLRYAKLEGANLQGVNLREANLRYANLRDAELQGAQLQGAQLEYVSLQGADLSRTDLQGVNLEDTILDLSGYELPQDFLIDSQLKMLTNNNFRRFFTCFIENLRNLKSLTEMERITNDVINRLPDLTIMNRMNSDEINQLCRDIIVRLSSPDRLPVIGGKSKKLKKRKTKRKPKRIGKNG